MTPKPAPRLQRATLACAALLACAAATAQPRTTLSVMPLGNLVGAAEAWGLNDAGTLVGNHTMPGGASQPFVWRGANLPPELLGAPGSALGVGNDGTVVGSAVFAGVGLRAFSWTSAGGLQNLGVLPGGGMSFASGVDEAGRIVGMSQVGGGQSRAFLLEPGGALQNLGTLGGTMSSAYAVAGGVVVGASTDATGALQAFAWTAAGGMQGVGPIAEVSEARGVNRNGLVVGRAVVGGDDLPFLWAPGDRARLLAGAEGFQGAALNDAGQVLLRHGAGGNSMLWVLGGTPTKLHTLAGSGVALFDATAINSHAQVAGTATGTATGGVATPALLTLHPEWQGGSGRWDSVGGAHWNWAGTGVAAAEVGRMHDVIIDPDVDAAVTVGQAEARSLRVGGRGTHAVRLELAGVLAMPGPAAVAAGGTLVAAGGLLRAGGITVDAAAALEATGYATLEGGAAGLVNAGIVRLGSPAPGDLSSITLASGLDNQAGGRVDVASQALSFDGSLRNAGTWNWIAGSIDAIGTERPGSGIVNTAGGTMNFEAGRHKIFSRAGRIDNAGLIRVAPGAYWDLNMDLMSTGGLHIAAGARVVQGFNERSTWLAGATGSGTLEKWGGQLSAAAAGTTVRIEPRLDLYHGSLVLGAAGLMPGAGLDHFVFDGPVWMLDTGLRLISVGGHAFQAGEVYDLFDWNGGVGGSFSTLDLPTLGAGLAWDTSDLYAGGTLGITAVPEPAGWALMLAGGALLAGLGRRRLAARNSGGNHPDIRRSNACACAEIKASAALPPEPPCRSRRPSSPTVPSSWTCST